MKAFESQSFIERALEECGVDPRTARLFLAKATREGKIKKIPDYARRVEVFEVRL